MNSTDPNAPVSVTGIHLLRLGDHVIVRAEIGGRWVEVIREHHDGSFSHIVEPGGMRKAAETHVFFHATPKNTCDHEWGGWREFPDGNGGEQVCKKCGLGAMADTLFKDF